MSKLASLVLTEFIKQFEKRYGPLKKEEKVVDAFPGMHVGTNLYYFAFQEVEFTLAVHLRRDGSEFAVKLFLGHDARKYFEEDPNKQKQFSEKAYRQNDPCVLKIIYHEKGEESWLEQQVPLHHPKRSEIMQINSMIGLLLTAAEGKIQR